MGVPAFFRWLSQRFPKIVVDVIETEQAELDGIQVPVDTSRPNPNGVEYDNLYLDMNNIIHPCTHPEDKEAPKTEGEMMTAIMEYIDRLFAIVRPRKLLYMAVDGVAPRAKMNQQRSRRFRAAKEAKEKKEIELKMRQEMKEKGQELPPLEEKSTFDSNCITPGTPFMQRITEGLKYYILNRLTYDSGWKGITVILSDSNVPGEGEHKIMDFIRHHRAQPDYDCNTRHVIYGLDADLIMLGLATHEPHFSILREVVFLPNNNNCYICGQPGHLASQCTGAAKVKNGEFDEKSAKKKPYQFLHLSVLREYLDNRLKVNGLPFDYSLENVIDDWVFLCFFVGNDFLPHLPTLEINEGAIDLLTNLYKKLLPTIGYITTSGEVYLDKLQILLNEIGQVEDSLLVKRMERNKQQKERRKRNRDSQLSSPQSSSPSSRRRVDSHNNMNPRMSTSPSTSTTFNNNNKKNIEAAAALRAALLGEGNSIADAASVSVTSSTASTSTGEDKKEDGITVPEEMETDLPPAKKYKTSTSPSASPSATVTTTVPFTFQHPSLISSKSEFEPAPSLEPNKKSKITVQIDGDADGGKTKLSSEKEAFTSKYPATISQGNLNMNNSRAVTDSPIIPDTLRSSSGSIGEDEEPYDPVRLGEEGWHERYYRMKFGWELSDPNDKQHIHRLGAEYIRGLIWVLKYYYKGCPSWTWYYPFHYAPFASEMANLNSEVNTSFEKGKPFTPLEQLMGVLPAASASNVPSSFQSFMTDPDSPIIHFYPSDFQIDMNGKRQSWQGVALLPFIDQEELLRVLAPLEQHLDPLDAFRNRCDCDILYVHSSHSLAKSVQALYKAEDYKSQEDWTPIDSANGSLLGRLAPYLRGRIASGAECSPPYPNLSNFISMTVSAKYNYPTLPEGKQFPQGLLKNVILPPKILTEWDLDVSSTPRRDRERGYYGGQNSAANRMINHALDTHQYKVPHYQQERQTHYYRPYERSHVAGNRDRDTYDRDRVRERDNRDRRDPGDRNRDRESNRDTRGRDFDRFREKEDYSNSKVSQFQSQPQSKYQNQNQNRYDYGERSSDQQHYRGQHMYPKSGRYGYDDQKGNVTQPALQTFSSYPQPSTSIPFSAFQMQPPSSVASTSTIPTASVGIQPLPDSGLAGNSLVTPTNYLLGLMTILQSQQQQSSQMHGLATPPFQGQLQHPLQLQPQLPTQMQIPLQTVQPLQGQVLPSTQSPYWFAQSQPQLQPQPQPHPPPHSQSQPSRDPRKK